MTTKIVPDWPSLNPKFTQTFKHLNPWAPKSFALDFLPMSYYHDQHHNYYAVPPVYIYHGYSSKDTITPTIAFIPLPLPPSSIYCLHLLNKNIEGCLFLLLLIAKAKVIHLPNIFCQILLVTICPEMFSKYFLKQKQ